MTDPKETRKSIRQWITRNYRQVITGTKSIDKEEFFNKVDTLANIECDIDEDDKSEDYYKKIKEMVSVIEEKESASKQPTQQRLNTAETQMSQFDGSAMSFPQFEALFDCKFDATYNIADRFMAFYNLVGNEPRKYLSGLRPDVDGFKEARRRMREVYGNASKIVEEIEAKLRKTKAITNLERVADLQDLLNTVLDAVSALTNIGMSNQYLNETLFGSITSKLPRSIIVSYYTQHKSNKIEKLIEVVRNEISLQTLANLQCKPVVNSAKTTQISTFGGQERNVSELKCLICGAGHRSISCDAFDAETRRAKAKGARLCFRCLRQGHMSRECRSKFVCQCGQSHSSVICLAQTRAKQVVTNVPRVN